VGLHFFNPVPLIALQDLDANAPSARLNADVRRAHIGAATRDDRAAEGCPAALVPGDDAEGWSVLDEPAVTMDPGRAGCLLISE
jgi:hypothetical protein